jgi:putative GTP pyrophosphokinase
MPEEGIFTQVQELQELQHLHNAAIKELQARLEILNDEFKVKHARNPIHHIESRLKTPASMSAKLKKRGCGVSVESARENLNDIAGVRVVCCYIDDVYQVADMLLRQSDIRLVKKKDYIKEPNYNGYRSLHLDIQLPVYLSDQTEYVTVEIQLRTVAMDFWASLEHDLRYKSDKNIPDDIIQEMLACSESIADIDRKMQGIYKKIQAL